MYGYIHIGYLYACSPSYEKILDLVLITVCIFMLITGYKQFDVKFTSFEKKFFMAEHLILTAMNSCISIRFLPVFINPNNSVEEKSKDYNMSS